MPATRIHCEEQVPKLPERTGIGARQHDVIRQQPPASSNPLQGYAKGGLPRASRSTSNRCTSECWGRRQERQRPPPDRGFPNLFFYCKSDASTICFRCPRAWHYLFRQNGWLGLLLELAIAFVLVVAKGAQTESRHSAGVP